MSECNLDNLVENLKQQETRLKRELAETRSEFKKKEQELKKELKRVQGGLSGLGGKSTGGSRKSSSQKKTDKPAAKAPEKAAETPDVKLVADTAAKVLQTGGPLTEEKLAEKVEGQLKAQGKPGSGVPAQLKKALQEPRFTNGAFGWKLAEHRVKAPNFQFEMSGQ